MIASGIAGLVAKFMSATHRGMASFPFVGFEGEKAKFLSLLLSRRPSTARASLPWRSSIVVKSKFMAVFAVLS